MKKLKGFIKTNIEKKLNSLYESLTVSEQPHHLPLMDLAKKSITASTIEIVIKYISDRDSELSTALALYHVERIRYQTMEQELKELKERLKNYNEMLVKDGLLY